MSVHLPDPGSVPVGLAESMQLASSGFADPDCCSEAALRHCLLDVVGVVVVNGLSRVFKAAHDCALEALLDDTDMMLCGKAVRISVYRSVRLLRKGEHAFRRECLVNIVDQALPNRSSFVVTRALAPRAFQSTEAYLHMEHAVEDAAQELSRALQGFARDLAARFCPGDPRWEPLINSFIGPWSLLHAYVDTSICRGIDPRVISVLIGAMRDQLRAGLPLIYAAVGEVAGRRATEPFSDVDEASLAAVRDFVRLQAAFACEDETGANVVDSHWLPDARPVDPVELLLSVVAPEGGNEAAAVERSGPAACVPSDRTNKITAGSFEGMALRVSGPVAGDDADGALLMVERSESDAAVAEVVDTLLSSIALDSRFPQRLAGEIMRLRTVLSCLVLTSPEQLCCPQGAARKYIDAVVEAGIARGWGACDSDPIVSVLLDSIRSVGSAAECSVVRLEEARIALIDGIRRITIRGAREDSDSLSAWSQVASWVGGELVGSELPPFVHDLLHRPWAQYMVHLLLRGEEDSVTYKNACSVVTNLRAAFDGWSIAPSRDPVGCQHTIQRLGEVAMELGCGLAAVGYSQRQVALIWRCLLDLTNAGSSPPEASGLVLRVGHDIESAMKAFAPEAKSPSDVDAQGRAPLRTQVPSLAALRAKLGSSIVAHLRVGGEYEIRYRGQASTRVRLCWRGIFSGKHVFVDRSGQKVVELYERDVRRMLDDGALVPADCQSATETGAARIINRIALGDDS